MNLNQLKKLGILGAAACALIFAPVSASAVLDKCSKDVTKNAAKATADTQKELAKCVDGWLKTDAKGKGHLKQSEKCQAGLEKIGLGAGDISGSTKTKLGKALDKVKAGIVKNCDDTDLQAMGILDTATWSTGDVGARLTVMGAFARAWSLQQAVNAQTSGALGNAADQRCVDDETQACLVDGDCATGTCGAAACPECADFSAPLNGAPTNRVSAGPCWASTCISDPSSSFITHQLVSGTPTPVTLFLTGNNPSEYCNVPEILPDGIGIVSGPAKSLSGTFDDPGTAPGDPLPLSICLEQQRAQGYISTVASGSLHTIDSAVCADVDSTFDGDDCSGFTNCTAQNGAPNSKVCRDLTVGAPAAGASATLNLQRIQATLSVIPPTDPCNPGSTALAPPATPGANLLATGTASGDFFDVGTATSAGTFTLTTAALAGAPFDTTGALIGDLDGTLVGVAGIVATDPAVASIVGHTLTEISTVCVSP